MHVKALLIGMVLLLSPFSLASTVTAPSLLPSGINWTFSVQLDPTDSFDRAEVLLDGTLLATIYSNGQILTDPFNGQFIIAAFSIDTHPSGNEGLEAHISHAGLGEGSHTLAVKTYQGSSLQNEDAVSVEVIAVFPATEAEQLRSQLSSIQEDTSKAVSDIEASAKYWNSEIAGIQERYSQLESGISALENKVTGLSDTSVNTAALEEQLYPLRVQVDELSADFFHNRAPLFSARESPTAFASYSSAPAMLGVGVVLVLAFLLFYLERRNRGSGLSNKGNLY